MITKALVNGPRGKFIMLTLYPNPFVSSEDETP
jgi:hypothetical protein